MQLIPSLIGLYGGFGAGTAYVFVRSAGGKGRKNTSDRYLLFPVFVSAYTSISYIWLRQYDTKAAAYINNGRASAAVGQFAITTAYKFAPAKKLSVFDYTQVIFATLWGVLFLGEVRSFLA